MKQLAKISAIQTKGLKKIFHEQKYGIKESHRSESAVNKNDKVSSTVRGRKRSILNSDDDNEDEAIKKPRDYNVIGVDDSSSESEDEVEIQIKRQEFAKEEEELSEKVDTSPMVVEKEPTVDQNNLLVKSEIVIDRKPATYIHVERDAEIQVARLKLPILAEEQVIMETISDNLVTIIAGSTGSGNLLFYFLNYLIVSFF